VGVECLWCLWCLDSEYSVWSCAQARRDSETGYVRREIGGSVLIELSVC
jgi:hypothetical protein